LSKVDRLGAKECQQCGDAEGETRERRKH
jgi:hypothetical protein